MIGKTILHYKILEKLGEGGMGVVYRADDTKLKRNVAIKFLPIRIAANAEERERFKIEAQAAAALNHPNIATIYAIEESDEEMFIAMEYIEGQELKDIMGAYRNTPLPATDIISYATQIARGLQAAHEKGVTHRDIKTANIMVTDKGQVKIMDFGLAKVRGGAQVTKVGTTLGTAAYMSPEQARGDEADHRSDIWSLGVVLYEMLTGRPPFKGDYEQAVIYSILNEEPDFPVNIAADIRVVLRKCMAKSPTERYQKIDDLINDLNEKSIGTKSDHNTSRSLVTRGRLVVYPAAIIIFIVAIIFIWKHNSSKEKSLSSPKRIAVLPFENLNGDSSQEYFSDGMTETIISDLANIRGLSIISRTSVMPYKNTTKTIKEIGRELNVGHILEGSVLTFGDKVRIFSQLIDIKTDTHLWAETYDREMEDIFSIQTDVANNIAAVLELTLAEKTRNRIKDRPTRNLEAYRSYLRGQFYLNKAGSAALDSSISLFKRSIELDSNFAMAYAELARAYILKNVQYTKESSWKEKAYISFQEALSLDAELAEAYVARATWYWSPDNNFQHENAIRDLQRAIDLKPGLSSAYELLALVQLHVGLLDKALKNGKNALELEPTSMWSHHFVAQVYYFQGRYSEALKMFETVEKQFNPVFRISFKSLTLFKLGRIKDAEVLIKKGLEKNPSESQLNSTYAIILASQKKYDQARRHMNIAIENQQSFRHIHHLYYNLAVSSALMNNKEEAIKWLEKSAEDGFPCYPFFESDPHLENIRSEGAYMKLTTDLKSRWEYFKTL